MPDMVGLMRFGLPVTPVPLALMVEAQTQRAAPAVAAVASAPGGGQTSGHYSPTPRPTISPQFAYANAGDGATADDGAATVGTPAPRNTSAVIDPPKPFDPDVLTGPPPTFEASLMQVEAHLRLSLARIDATRHAHPMDRPPKEPPKVEAKGDKAPVEGAVKADDAPVAAPAPDPVKAATAAGPETSPTSTDTKPESPPPEASAEPAPVE